MTQKGLDVELRKNFQVMKFREFFELASMVVEYKELLKEESYKNKNIMASYYQEVEGVVLVQLRYTDSCVCPLLKKKPVQPERKKNHHNVHYTFDVAKTDDIFNLVK